MRLLASCLFVLAVLLAYCAGKAEADHNSPWLPGLPSPVMERAQQRGFLTYRLDQGASAYPNFRTQAADVAQAGLFGLGIPAFETDGAPDIWLTMPADQTFISTCGSGAAGCILYWADPILIYFRRALFYPDWKTTLAHEGINYGHALGEHEQYYDKTFTCKSLADLIRLGPGPTVMSCGTGLWQPQPFDIETVSAVMLPQQFRGGALQGNVVWYGGSDARTTRIAILFRTYAGYLYFSGRYLTPVVGCQAIVCGGAVVDAGRCQEVLLGHENALPGSWGRELQSVGWSSCF